MLERGVSGGPACETSGRWPHLTQQAVSSFPSVKSCSFAGAVRIFGDKGTFSLDLAPAPPSVPRKMPDLGTQEMCVT